MGNVIGSKRFWPLGLVLAISAIPCTAKSDKSSFYGYEDRGTSVAAFKLQLIQFASEAKPLKAILKYAYSGASQECEAVTSEEGSMSPEP